MAIQIQYRCVKDNSLLSCVLNTERTRLVKCEACGEKLTVNPAKMSISPDKEHKLLSLKELGISS